MLLSIRSLPNALQGAASMCNAFGLSRLLTYGVKSNCFTKPLKTVKMDEAMFDANKIFAVRGLSPGDVLSEPL